MKHSNIILGRTELENSLENAVINHPALQKIVKKCIYSYFTFIRLDVTKINCSTEIR